jgi:hypothetical protein
MEQRKDLYYDENFSNKKWKSFTNVWKTYRTNHKENNNINTLEAFSHFIIQYPSKFSKRSQKNAQAYLKFVDGNLKKKTLNTYIMGRKKAIMLDPVGGDIGDDIRGAFDKVGHAISPIQGLNPLTLGYDIGHDLIGPALFGRGLHIHHHHHHHHPMAGEGIFDDMKQRGKQLIKHVAPMAIREGQRHLKELAPSVIKKGANQLKKMTKNNSFANSIIDQGADMANQKANQYIDKGADMANQKIQGLGVKKGRFVKGSKEAKEFMAQLRAKRNK